MLSASVRSLTGILRRSLQISGNPSTSSSFPTAVMFASTKPTETTKKKEDGDDDVSSPPPPTGDDVETSSSEQPQQLPRHPYSKNVLASLKLDQYPFYVEREWWKNGKRMTFWATWRQNRDVNRRLCLQEYGPDRMRLKALKENTVLPQAIRDAAAEDLHAHPRRARPKLILNMCMFTGRQRGKIKPYRVNRHIFRKLADHSQLSGVQRAMWS